MPRFKILHISDSHFCREPNRRNRYFNLRDRKSETLFWAGNNILGWNFCSYRPAASIQSARYVYDKRRYLDAIVCTGDLATTGQEVDLEVAERYFTKNSIGQYAHNNHLGALLMAQRPIVLMPGNHDRYGNFGKPGNQNFDRTFGPPHWNDGGIDRIGVSRFSKGETDLCIIAADFCLKEYGDSLAPDPFGYLGQGHTYDDILGSLLSETDNARDSYESTVVIWAVHFPPVDVTDTRMLLIHHQKLMDAAEDKEIQLILCGHLHKKHNPPFKTCFVTGATSVSAVDIDGLHGMQTLEITTNKQTISEINRQEIDWSPDQEMFVEANIYNHSF